MFKVFQKFKTNAIQSEEQAMIIKFYISNEFGSKEEQEYIRNLAITLEKVVSNPLIAEYDGDEYGNGEANLYFYSQNIDEAYNVIKPIVSKSILKPIKIVRRYGSANNLQAKETEEIIN